MKKQLTRRQQQLTVLINYDTVKYMKTIQTWFSDLSDWFYNLKNLNTIAFTVNLVDEMQDEMLEVGEISEDQILELYKRVRVLELAESKRQFEELINSIEKKTDSLLESQTKKSKSKKVAKKK